MDLIQHHAHAKLFPSLADAEASGRDFSADHLDLVSCKPLPIYRKGWLVKVSHYDGAPAGWLAH